MGKSKLRLTIQDLKDLGIIKYKKKRKNKRHKKIKKVYTGHNMDGIKSSSNHLVGYGSVLTNTPTLQLNNENAVMQRDANIKAIKNQDNESRMVGYNPQLRQIEDNYNDMKGAITHLWTVNNHYGNKEPRIEEIDDEEENVDIFSKNRNDYKYDSKDTSKSLSSNEFLVDGDKTPSMTNDVYESPVSSFETRAGGGMTNKRATKQQTPYYDYDPKDFPKEPDDSLLSEPEEKKVDKKAVKTGAPNLNVGKIELQHIYSEFGGDNVKLLTKDSTVDQLRKAIRLLPEYKAVLKYTKANK